MAVTHLLGESTHRDVYRGKDPKAMSNYEQLSTGKKLESLSLKVTQLQQDVAALRNELRSAFVLLQKISRQLDPHETIPESKE